MSLRDIKKEELKEVFQTLEDAFSVCEIDYYLIGALAREVWFAKADLKFRTTKDVDFAILVGSHKKYEQVREYLEAHKGYKPSTTNAFVVIAPDGTAIDLLPFGSIEIDDNVAFKGEGLTNMKVNGFMEVYETGTENVEILHGLHFEVATLPAIVLLKLIAYDDRPEKRIKDARDIANIIVSYFELQADLIYKDYNLLFAEDQADRSLEEISAIVIGQEMKKILGGNKQLHNRIIAIISGQIEKEDKSDFIRNMAQEVERGTDEMNVSAPRTTGCKCRIMV